MLKALKRLAVLAAVVEGIYAYQAAAVPVMAHHGAQSSAPAVYAVAASANEALANQMAASRYGWRGVQLTCLDDLWTEESGFSVTADNAQSGAYGIPQALPAGKMASAGADWRTNPATQVRWGLGYIHDRYGMPCAAWAFETSHTPNWY